MAPFEVPHSTFYDWLTTALSGFTAYYLPSSKPLLTLVVAIFTPAIIISLNVLQQLLRTQGSDPPNVFHWIPFIGSAIPYGTDPVAFLNENRKKYGDVFTFTMFGCRITAALGAKGNNFVLGGKSLDFNAEDAYTHFTTPVFGKDVIYDVPNEIVMQQKRFIKVALSSEKFRSYVGMIEEEVEDFLNNDPSFKTYQLSDINLWGKFDVTHVMQEITILTASRTLQGKEVRRSLDKSFAQLYNDLDGGFTALNFLFPNLPLASYRKRDRAHKKMSEFYIDIIRKRAENVDQNEPDIISSLFAQSYRNGNRIKEHEVAHLMIALLMAGQHTSTATGSWALLHIARSPDIAEALYQEQLKHFGTPDGELRPITFDELRGLPTLDAVIRETLRLHPPIHTIMRKVRDDVPVPPTLSAPRSTKSRDSIYVVPKGNFVLASPLVSQIDPAVWKNADIWDPARWRDPAGVAANAVNDDTSTGETIDYGFGTVSKGTESPYQPFGAGRHRCIGEQFAYLQLGVIISTLIRKLEFRLPHNVSKHNYHTMIVMPLSPREIHYRRRNVD